MTLLKLLTRKILARRAESTDWLLQGYQSETDFRINFAGVRRKLGNDTLHFSREETAQLVKEGFPSAASRPMHIHGRTVLLLQATQSQPAQTFPRFIHHLFVRGDTMEQCAILCTLPLLPQPVRFADTAAQAARGYVREVFDTLACHNPYPACYLPDEIFNQMILKALFIGSPLKDVIGLEERCTPELTRMVQDFARERRLAGRAIPQDIDLIL